MCKLLVYMCKHQWQMLWQMICQFNHIYTCNLPCMIPMIWNVQSLPVCKPPVYMCKPLVYTCKPQWQMLWQMLCQFNHIYTCNLPCMIVVYMCKPLVYTCKLAVNTQAKTVITFQIVGIVQGRLHM